MRSISQPAPISHTLFPPPLLMLCAPRIAGLLPARVPEPEAPPDLKMFTYTHPGLAELPAAERERLLDGAKTLLDVALDFALHGLGEDALRAAEVVFHRAAGGHPPKHFSGPTAYNAEVDADVMTALVDLSRIRIPTREEARRELDEKMKAYRDQNGSDSWLSV